MAAKVMTHPSVADRRAQGADARIQTDPDTHTGWAPAADRPDPVTLLEEQNVTREPDLVPVRHGRKDSKSGRGKDQPAPGSVAWAAKQADKNFRKAQTRDSLQALSKLGELVDGEVPDRQPTTDRGSHPGSAGSVRDGQS